MQLDNHYATVLKVASMLTGSDEQRPVTEIDLAAFAHVQVAPRMQFMLRVCDRLRECEDMIAIIFPACTVRQHNWIASLRVKPEVWPFPLPQGD